MRTMFERFSLAGVMREGEGGVTPPATTAPATTAPPATTTFDWGQNGVDADGLNYVQNKGWKSPADLVMSYRNLEKLRGVPAEQLLQLPAADAPLEAWSDIYGKLGRPAAPDGYKFELPDGDDGAFAKEAANWMHKANLTQGQATELFKTVSAWAAEQAKGEEQAGADALKKTAEAQAAALQKDWGGNFDTNMAIAQRGAKAFGIDEATIDKLQGALGYDGVMKLMHNLGSKVGTDAGFVTGDGKGGFQGNVSQEQARAEIKRLQNDRTFAERFASSDPAVRAVARAEMRKLQVVAYPGEQALA